MWLIQLEKGFTHTTGVSNMTKCVLYSTPDIREVKGNCEFLSPSQVQSKETMACMKAEFAKVLQWKLSTMPRVRLTLRLSFIHTALLEEDILCKPCTMPHIPYMICT